MNNTGIILILAYPETIVKISSEWYLSYLRYVGIGTKNYVRAGHAALVLIEKATGILEYHDFGRYITPKHQGRVRGVETDHELKMPLVANIEDGEITNLNSILTFLATHSKITHGKGKMIASVCDVIDYRKARSYISMMQSRDFVPYAVFKGDASNCSRFVTDTLIAGVTDSKIKRRLMRSKRFTPSTVGNVVIGDSKENVYEVSDQGEFRKFSSTVRKENVKYFLDRLKMFTPDHIGNLQSKPVDGVSAHAQWLSGIGAGAWFELHKTEDSALFRFMRISSYGNIDVNGMYRVQDDSFQYEKSYEFVHYSNCKFFHIKQSEKVYRFDLAEKIS